MVSGPAVDTEIYSLNPFSCSRGNFRGMLFADFHNQYQRDMAVALVKSADTDHGGIPVWAAQGRSPVESATRSFCFGVT